MPNKIAFTDCILRSFARNAKGGHADFSAGFTETVREVMSWPLIPEELTGSTLEGELHLSTCTLAIAGKAENFAISIDAQRLAKFETVRLELEGKSGKGHRTELRFRLLFTDFEGCAKLERYLVAVGESKGKLSLTYTLAPQQQELIPDGVSPTDEQRNAVQ